MTTSRDRLLSIFNSLPEITLDSGGERDQHLGASVRKKRFAWDRVELSLVEAYRMTAPKSLANQLDVS